MLGVVAAIVSRVCSGDWLLFLAGILLALYIVGTWNYDYFQRRGLVSTKPRLPFFGDFFGLFTGKSLFHIIEDLYNAGKGHDVFGVFEFTRPMYMIRDPELIKHIAVKDFDNFMNHRSMASAKTDPIMGKNLFNIKDQEWKDMRTTLSPAFTTSKIKGMLPYISQCANQLTQHLQIKYANSKEGKTKSPLPVDMKDMFTHLTNDAIATIAFGVSCDSLKNPKNEFYAMGKVLTTFSKLRSAFFFVTLGFPKLTEVLGIRLLDTKATNFFLSLVHEAIRERKKGTIFRPDMLQLLIQAQEGKLKADAENSNEVEKVASKKIELTDEDVSAQAITFFFAGFEAVSAALCLTTHVLSHYPDVQKRLQEEISQVMEEMGGKPTYESVQGMKYLDAVINETFRLYPPGPGTDRVCQRDTVIPAGVTSTPFTISKGAMVQIPIIGLHHDPLYWEEPDKFDPERFSEENKHKIKPFSYLPFGVGPRFCIAQRFALIEVKLVLVHLLANFDLHPCAKTKNPLEYTSGANVMVRGGFWCGLTPREV